MKICAYTKQHSIFFFIGNITYFYEKHSLIFVFFIYFYFFIKRYGKLYRLLAGKLEISTSYETKKIRYHYSSLNNTDFSYGQANYFQK